MHKNKLPILCLTCGLLVVFFWGILEPQAQLTGRMFKGDEVLVILGKVSSKDLRQGDKVAAHVMDHFKKGDDILINQREPVWAKVKSLKKPGIYGKKAELVISFDSTKSAGGTTIPLTGEITLKGKGKGIIPYILFPIGWLFKGSHVEKALSDSCVSAGYVNVPEHIDVDL